MYVWLRRCTSRDATGMKSRNACTLDCRGWALGIDELNGAKTRNSHASVQTFCCQRKRIGSPLSAGSGGTRWRSFGQGQTADP